MYFTDEMLSKLLEYTDTFEKGFIGQHQYYKRFLAINAFKKDIKPDIEGLKSLTKSIRKKTGLFSPFRATCFQLSALLLQNYKRPEEAFDRLLKHYDLLKSKGFKKTQYLPMVSYTLDSLMFDKTIQDMAIQTETYRQELVEKAVKIYGEMKVNHPWLTGGDDYPLALLIAHSGKETERIEQIYEGLYSEGLKKGNQLQSLANIAALSGKDEIRVVEVVMSVIGKLKGKGMRVNQTMYPGIGLLSIVTEQEEHLENVVEITKELKKIKGYKFIDKNLLFMFAVNLVSEDIKKELSTKTITETCLTVTIEEMVMAQVAVMIAVMAASTTAITAST